MKITINYDKNSQEKTRITSPFNKFLSRKNRWWLCYLFSHILIFIVLFLFLHRTHQPHLHSVYLKVWLTGKLRTTVGCAAWFCFAAAFIKRLVYPQAKVVQLTTHSLFRSRFYYKSILQKVENCKVYNTDQSVIF